MFQSLTKTLARAALVISAVTAASSANAWETGERQKHRQFYQNITAADLPKLISGKVWVNYDPTTDLIGASAFSQDGSAQFCGNVDGRATSFTWTSVVFDNKPAKERYPLFKETRKDGSNGLGAFKYSATTGQLAIFLAQRPYWWESSPGHLQTEIPAAIYSRCPDFPSAESLGLKVNTRQTSTKYREMIAQDPGNRVRRPDLVTDVTVERY
jgi:hypothetical protein